MGARRKTGSMHLLRGVIVQVTTAGADEQFVRHFVITIVNAQELGAALPVLVRFQVRLNACLLYTSQRRAKLVQMGLFVPIDKAFLTQGLQKPVYGAGRQADVRRELCNGKGTLRPLE